jgi:ribonucleoside-diphosphate reductase alpha chain
MCISDRAYAAAITSIVCGHAYAASARIARDATGPFSGFQANREAFLGVMAKHRRHVDQIDGAYVPYELVEAARSVWDDALATGREHGYRNAQATVLAPTGTIGFMMDCDTTGIEPDIALVKYKRLVGGGTIKIVNQTVPEALATLGYDDAEIRAILAHIDAAETIEGAPALKDDHLAVFDCAFRPHSGKRSIAYMGHVRMMAACQPFLSGAISKTVNLPNDCTVEDIERAYVEAWKLGLKAIAVYRDGCKRTQPLSTGSGETSGEAKATEDVHVVFDATKPFGPPSAVRRRLPDERASLTHKFSVGGHDGYITCGLYADGTPGEIFVRMAKEGSTVAGLMDSFALSISLALQHGVPLRLLCEKLRGTQFEPRGFTGNPEIPMAKSIMDYIFSWLNLKFLVPREATEEGPPAQLDLPRVPVLPGAAARAASGDASSSSQVWVSETDAPTCHECGSIMVRSGACHKCSNCGATSGCS